MVFEDLKDTFFVVEASSFEVHMIWREWHEAIPMEQDSLGFVETIGHIDNRPVCVDLRRFKIWNKWVVFYEGCSQVVDHEMVRKWVDENILKHCSKWDQGHRVSHTNAWNFPHCVSALEAATGNKRNVSALR